MRRIPEQVLTRKIESFLHVLGLYEDRYHTD